MKNLSWNAFRNSFILLVCFISLNTFAITHITRIEYQGKKSPHLLTITADGPLTIQKTENEEDHQIILEIENAKFLTKNVGRRLDASSFPGNISLISPYKVEGKNAVRVIVQLRKAGVSSNDLAVNGKSATLSLVSKKGSDSTQAKTHSKDSLNAAQSESTDSGEAAPVADNGGIKLEDVEDSLKKKNYIGRHITVNFKDADIVDVFKLIGETSGFNLVIGADVTGKLTLSLTDVPWDQVLDLVLTTMRLGAERNGNILRIATLNTLTAEKDQLVRARNAANLSAPRVTRIFPISYAKPSDLVGLLTKFGGGSAGTNDSASKDTIVVDERTNSLVIQDIQDNINRMAKLIELMDQPTPQVQIEAKIVEASEEFSKSLSGELGGGAQNKLADGTTSGYGYGSTKSGSIAGSRTGATPLSTATLASTTAAKASTLGMGLNIAKILNFRLNALLSLNEDESKTRTISSPRLVVLNKQKANIVQGQPVLVPVTTTNPVNGSAQTSSSVQNAVLSLDVTPTVTNDGNILMDISVTSNIPKGVGTDQNGIATRSVKTLVVTESGGTMVIGGVYTNSENHTEGGVPFLRKLPLIGTLFGSNSNSTARNELFVFISPRVLNEADSVGAPQANTNPAPPPSSINSTSPISNEAQTNPIAPSAQAPEKLAPNDKTMSTSVTPDPSLSLDASPALENSPAPALDLPPPPSNGGDAL